MTKKTILFAFVVDLSLEYKHGRLVLEVPLPSRHEKCLFFLRPMLMNVGDLITDLQREDSGLTAAVLSKGVALRILQCRLEGIAKPGLVGPV